MADKAMGKHMYKLLLDGVEEAISSSNTKFTSILQNIRLTLIPLLPRIAQFDPEMLLQYDLQGQMEEGMKLFGQVSRLGRWNYQCKKRSYSDQLEALFESLRGILCVLKAQEQKDTNELLLVERSIFERQNDLNTRLCGLLQEHNELDDIGQVENGGRIEDGLENLFSHFLGLLVLEVDVEVNGRRSFKPVLVDLKLTARLFQPLLQEISESNNLLHLSEKEVEDLREQLQRGIELVGKFSESHKGYEYLEKLLELDEYLRGLLCFMRKKVAKNMERTLVSVCNLEMMITGIKELCRSQNHSDQHSDILTHENCLGVFS